MKLLQFVFIAAAVCLFAGRATAQGPAATVGASAAHGQTTLGVTVTNLGWRRGETVEVCVWHPDGSELMCWVTTVVGSGGGTGINVQGNLSGPESNHDGLNVTVDVYSHDTPGQAVIGLQATIQ